MYSFDMYSVSGFVILLCDIGLNILHLSSFRPFLHFTGNNTTSHQSCTHQ